MWFLECYFLFFKIFQPQIFHFRPFGSWITEKSLVQNYLIVWVNYKITFKNNLVFFSIQASLFFFPASLRYHLQQRGPSCWVRQLGSPTSDPKGEQIWKLLNQKVQVVFYRFLFFKMILDSGCCFFFCLDDLAWPLTIFKGPVKIFKGPDRESTQKEWTLKSFCCVSFKDIGNMPDQFEGSLVDRHLPSTVAEHDDLRRGLRIRVAIFPKFKQHDQRGVTLHREMIVLYTVCGGANM